MTKNYKTALSIIVGLLLAALVIGWGVYQQQLMANRAGIQQTNMKSPEQAVFSWLGQTTEVPVGACLFGGSNDQCFIQKAALCEEDMEVAKIAWKYYENNYHPETGLVNSVNQYTSTTLWDTGSALAATISAHDFGFINQKAFDDRVVALLKTLNTMVLFNGEAPNKAYNTKTGEMVDYNNKATPDGIGVSTLDLARIVSWLNTLLCQHPKYEYQVNQVLSRWDYRRLIQNGQMYGLARDPVSNEIQVLQEGRLGYEQYAGKIFAELGFDQSVAASYTNEFRRDIEIYDIPIAYDSRDPREFGAYNYVVTESYGLDVIENGYDEINRELVDNIYDVQVARWRETGAVTAVSEDNVDRAPWFIYNTIFTAGLSWNTTTDTGVRHDELKAVSTKAAFTLATLFPEKDYSKRLIQQIASVYDPDKGWYSGIYENGNGYNKAITANTNGIILSGLLYKKYGSFYPQCKRCGRAITLNQSRIDDVKACHNQKQCKLAVPPPMSEPPPSEGASESF